MSYYLSFLLHKDFGLAIFKSDYNASCKTSRRFLYTARTIYGYTVASSYTRSLNALKSSSGLYGNDDLLTSLIFVSSGHDKAQQRFVGSSVTHFLIAYQSYGFSYQGVQVAVNSGSSGLVEVVSTTVHDSFKSKIAHDVSSIFIIYF